MIGPIRAYGGLLLIKDTTLVAMATPLEKAPEKDSDRSSVPKALSYGERIVKIGLVEHEIILAQINHF